MELGVVDLRPMRVIELQAHPDSALDRRTKRFVEKELRAAWGAKGARWRSNLDSRTGAGPAFYLSCNDKGAARSTLEGS